MRERRADDQHDDNDAACRVGEVEDRPPERHATVPRERGTAEEGQPATGEKQQEPQIREDQRGRPSGRSFHNARATVAEPAAVEVRPIKGECRRNVEDEYPGVRGINAIEVADRVVRQRF